MANYSAHMRAVVANVLKTLPKPGLPMTITYLSGATVGFGNTLTPTEVTEVPTVSWEADPQAFYTVILTDPDAPSRDLPAFREFIHWVSSLAEGVRRPLGRSKDCCRFPVACWLIGLS